MKVINVTTYKSDPHGGRSPRCHYIVDDYIRTWRWRREESTGQRCYMMWYLWYNDMWCDVFTGDTDGGKSPRWHYIYRWGRQEGDANSGRSPRCHYKMTLMTSVKITSHHMPSYHITSHHWGKSFSPPSFLDLLVGSPGLVGAAGGPYDGGFRHRGDAQALISPLFLFWFVVIVCVVEDAASARGSASQSDPDSVTPV